MALLPFGVGELVSSASTAQLGGKSDDDFALGIHLRSDPLEALCAGFAFRCTNADWSPRPASPRPRGGLYLLHTAAVLPCASRTVYFVPFCWIV